MVDNQYDFPDIYFLSSCGYQDDIDPLEYVLIEERYEIIRESYNSLPIFNKKLLFDHVINEISIIDSTIRYNLNLQEISDILDNSLNLLKEQFIWEYF